MNQKNMFYPNKYEIINIVHNSVRFLAIQSRYEIKTGKLMYNLWQITITSSS